MHAVPVPVAKEGERVLCLQLGRQGRKHAERRTGAEQAAVHTGGAGVHPGERTTERDRVVSAELTRWRRSSDPQRSKLERAYQPGPDLLE